ncbi:MAG TPA: YtzH-like family protein [Pseudogracilibacillus sp.]|nr:YtzH-like family protein [Pseudogracilibacillus sp.]
MYLSIQNQLTLLHDLLNDHITYKTVSIDEYKQIKKLVQSIITNRKIEEQLLTILPEIYYYSIKGESAQSLPSHILENEQKIKRWLTMINEVKLHVSS